MVYGRAELGKLRSRWFNDAVKVSTWRFGLHYLPGTALPALLALGVTSTGAGERGGPPDFACGWYGVEWRWWLTAAGDAETRSVLGRAGPVNAAAFTADTEAQCFAGMRTYARQLAQVEHSLRSTGHAALVSESPQWRYRVAAAAYSSGPATIAGLLRATGAQLAPVPPNGNTWRSLAAVVDRSCPSGAGRCGAIPCGGKWHAADTVIRCDGRFESGLALARAVDAADAAWFVGAIDSEVEAATARRLVALVNGTA